MKIKIIKKRILAFKKDFSRWNLIQKRKSHLVLKLTRKHDGHFKNNSRKNLQQLNYQNSNHLKTLVLEVTFVINQ